MNKAAIIQFANAKHTDSSIHQTDLPA